MYQKKNIYIYIYIRDNIDILVMYCGGSDEMCKRSCDGISLQTNPPHCFRSLSHSHMWPFQLLDAIV